MSKIQLGWRRKQADLVHLLRSEVSAADWPYRLTQKGVLVQLGRYVSSNADWPAQLLPALRHREVTQGSWELRLEIEVQFVAEQVGFHWWELLRK